MKRLVIVLVSLLAFSISAYAQMNEGMKPEQQGQMGSEGQMPMMQMCQEMMKQKMGEGQMPMCPMCMQMMEGHKEMMQMMMEMMQIQKKMMKAMKLAGKKEMMMEMDKMIKKMKGMMEKMNNMMSMPMGMMGGMSAEAKMKCAEEWLKKAIELHEVHIKDPKTATEASQMEMMEQMKKAYECITKEIQPESHKDKEKGDTESQKQNEHKH